MLNTVSHSRFLLNLQTGEVSHSRKMKIKFDQGNGEDLGQNYREGKIGRSPDG